jgi:uncharacterized protein YkwD
MLPRVGSRGASRRIVHGVSLAALVACCLGTPATAARHHRGTPTKRHQHKPHPSLPRAPSAPSGGDDGASGGSGTFPPPNPPAQLGATCPGADGAPSRQSVADFGAALLCLINEQRAQQQLGALAEDAQLLAAAQHHADDMLAGDYFGHTSPSGETVGQRAYDSGYTTPGRRYRVGEDLAWGTYDPTGRDLAQSAVTPSAIVAGWMRSPTHRAIIVTPEFRDAAVGVVLAAPASLASGQPGVTVTVELGVHG